MSGGPLDTLKDGGKVALARALARLESHPDAEDVRDLLDAAYHAPRAHVVGITGPPGVGKSTLMNALVRQWRDAGKTVGIIAVDPSSRRSGGALLGDRTRLSFDPADQGVFVRSMAARDRLGGLASLTVAGMVLMRAVFDVVLIETVGVGQSETDVADVADTVVFCVQPGSGDSLQYMKAGIAEIPDIVLVTKADMRKEAARARADVMGALSLSGTPAGDRVPVLLVSSQTGEGIAEAVATISENPVNFQRVEARRAEQATAWFRAMVAERFGRAGLEALDGSFDPATQSPFVAAARFIAGHSLVAGK